MTFKQYLISLRLNYAENMLKSGEYSVSEVALQCGFSDIFYFSKLFKEKKGFRPPACFRRKEGRKRRNYIIIRRKSGMKALIIGGSGGLSGALASWQKESYEVWALTRGKRPLGEGIIPLHADRDNEEEFRSAVWEPESHGMWFLTASA